jgi:hypothetical protein
MAGGQRRAAVERVAARRYWRAEDARVVVEAWKASGEGVARYAGRYGIEPRRLSRWSRALEEVKEAPVRFHAVRLVEREGSRVRRGEGSIEIELNGGAKVRVPEGFAAEDLERVLRVLGAGAPC